jgi:hypothetical protein
VKYRGLALLMLATLMVAQFAWQAFLPDKQFAGWTAGQGAQSALLAALVGLAYPSRAMRAAAVLVAACGLLTFACSAWWLIAPWIPTGRDRCSAAFDLPVGVLASLLALVLAWRIYVGGRDA